MPHPLFEPLNDGDDEPEVESVHVTRFEDGGYKWAPYKFGADELTELHQVHALFGGGKYELVARAGGRMTAKRRYELAGKPKPLVMVQSDDATEPEQPRAVAMVTPTNDTSMVGVMMNMMTMMAEGNRATTTMMMQFFQATSQAQTAMITAMLSRDSDGAKATIQAIQATNERALQGQAQVFATMLETLKGGKEGGKDSLEAFKEGLELGSSGDDDGDSTMSELVDGLRMASALAGTGTPTAEGAA